MAMTDILRGKVLYYYARAMLGRRRLSRKKLTKLLELPDEGWKIETLRALKCLPKDLDFAMDGDALSLEFVGRKRQEATGLDAAVIEVFDAWRETTGRTERVVLDYSRRKVIRARLEDGYTVAALKTACEGIMKSDFHTGQNDRGQKYTDVKHVFRDAQRIDSFISLAKAKKRATNSARVDRAQTETTKRKRRRRRR